MPLREYTPNCRGRLFRLTSSCSIAAKRRFISEKLLNSTLRPSNSTVLVSRRSTVRFRAIYSASVNTEGHLRYRTTLHPEAIFLTLPRFEDSMIFHTLRFIQPSILIAVFFVLLPVYAGTIRYKHNPTIPLPPKPLSVASTGAVTVHASEEISVQPHDTTFCLPDSTSDGAPTIFCQGETTKFDLTGSVSSYALETEAGSMTRIDDGISVCSIAKDVYGRAIYYV